MGNGRNEVVVQNKATGELEIIDLATGEVVTNNAAPPATIYTFSYAKALLICQMVKEGKTWAEIQDEPDMPPLHVISHWQRTDRMFAEELKLARRERAEVYHDRAMQIANAATSAHKDHVPGMALAAKIYQWGAEKANPESYGNKVTHEGSETKPILMRVVNTGISRAAKPDVLVVEQKGDTHVKESDHRESHTGDHGADKESEGMDD
jgi:hypothetical protein